jgi:hypothetical protein
MNDGHYIHENMNSFNTIVTQFISFEVNIMLGYMHHSIDFSFSYNLGRLLFIAYFF